MVFDAVLMLARIAVVVIHVPSIPLLSVPVIPLIAITTNLNPPVMPKQHAVTKECDSAILRSLMFAVAPAAV